MITVAGLIGALLVKPALVVAAAAAIAAGLRRRPSAARHAVWAGAVAATLVLPLLGVTLPPLRVPAPFDLAGGPASGATGFTRRAAAPDGSAQAVPAARGPRGPVRLDVPGLADRLAAGIAIAWALGALLLGTRRVVAGVRLRRIVRRARPVSSGDLGRIVADVSRAARVRGPVEVRASEETATPAVAGVLRPVVLLPVAADVWPPADLWAVLVHELEHVARRDGVLNLLGDVAAIVYWCNPAVRAAVRRMRAESEGACDERVLGGGAEPDAYAHLLLRIAQAARGTGGLPGAATAMARPRELESRLLAVLDSRASRMPLPHWVPAALAGAAILIAVPTAALTLRAAPATQLPGPEPDRLGDSLAGPRSEWLAPGPDGYRVAPGAVRALAGPDSALARRLVAALEREPGDEADLVRDRAAWALAQARDGRLVEPLVEALEARDWRVQAYAAWVLAAARDARAVPRLIPLLGHPVWRLRAMAAHALRASGDPRAEDAMNEALTDPAWQVRVEAVEYFAAAASPAPDQRLRARLQDRHVAVRLAAQRALITR